MAFLSPRMALKIWNAASDPYDHEQLADNLIKLDQHDHSQGRGTPIGGDGIRDGSITARHIYPGAIGDDAISVSSRLPIGSVIDYYCVSPLDYQSLTSTDFRVCDGTTVVSGEHAMPGVSGDFVLPNLIGKVVVGANPAKALNFNSSPGNALDNAPGVNGVGGSNASHTHSVPEHYHGHSLTTGGATANLNDPGHVHGLYAENGAFAPGGVGVQMGGDIIGASGGSVVPGFIGSATTGITQTNHTHSVSGPVGNTSTGVNGNAAMGTGTQDGRMAHVGLLKIMRVR